MASPLTLTVFTPNFNHGRYLRQCIEAVLAQTRRPDQYIILDDGSTDESRSILEEVARRHPWIQIHLNEVNRGVMWGTRFLLDHTTSDYFYGGAADDHVSPRFFEKAMHLAQQHPRAGILFGQVACFTESGDLKQVERVRAWEEPGFIAPERFIPEYFDREIATHSLSAATIYRREAFHAQKHYHHELRSWSDTFAIRSIALQYGGCYLPEVCTSVRLDAASYSGRIHRDPRAYLDIIFRAAALMRTGEFRALYPVDHVESWLERYRLRIVLGSVKRALLAGKPWQALSNLRWLAYRPAGPDGPVQGALL